MTSGMLKIIGLAMLAAAAGAIGAPNVIVILTDDMGYGDIGAHGNNMIKTPAIDELAASGVSFSQFYASANICTPSRAGLLTGRFAIRSGLGWDVVGADSSHGLPESEITIAELLADAGYATGMVGKWHLGNRPPHWPTHQGFQTFWGANYSNDMPRFALFDGERQIENPVVQHTLTERYTQQSLKFIRANADRPFFLFLSHTFPHIPLYASAEGAGKSRAGTYGDVIEDIDRSTGKILGLLDDLGLRDNTLVLFTSDNGAWWEGSNGDARGAKGSTWDGGYRVPLIAAWPAGIPAGQARDAPAMNTDLLPTIAEAAGVAIDPQLTLDGRSLLPLLRDKAAGSPHRYLYYFADESLVAIRSGRWKLVTHGYYRHVLGAIENFDRLPGFDDEYRLLFDMSTPLGQRYSQARDHPDIVQRLQGELSAARARFAPLRTHQPRPVFPPPNGPENR